MALARFPIVSRAAWHGRDLARSEAWLRRLDERQQGELDRALERGRRRPLLEITKHDFPLAATADLLAEIGEELEDGLGVVRLRGVAVERYGEDDLRRIFWGIGCHLGTALYQNARGEIMGEVRDETRDPAPSF